MQSIMTFILFNLFMWSMSFLMMLMPGVECPRGEAIRFVPRTRLGHAHVIAPCFYSHLCRSCIASENIVRVIAPFLQLNQGF